MTNPFDTIPGNLFNLLSAQGRLTLQRHYMAILLRLYALAEFNRFGLTREVAISEMVDYLKGAGAEAEIAAEIEANPDDSFEESTGTVNGQKSIQDYASYMLRRLAETGWIEREQHADYTETIILPDYAFTLLEAFRTHPGTKATRIYRAALYGSPVNHLCHHQQGFFSGAGNYPGL